MSNDQITNLEGNYQARKYCYQPEELQSLWSQVDPQYADLFSYTSQCEDWIKANWQFSDLCLLQGDYGMMYHMVTFCKSIGLKPIYATTKRIVQTNQTGNEESTITRVFKHVRFRFY